MSGRGKATVGPGTRARAVARAVRAPVARVLRRRALLVRGPALACVAAVLGAAPARSGWTVETGVDHRSWEVATFLGEATISQTIVPIDLSGPIGPVEVRAGFDLGGSGHDDWRGDADLSGASRVRLGATGRVAEGRLRFDLDGSVGIEDGPYTPGESVLLGWISDPLLPVPLSDLGAGDRWRVALSGLLVSTRRSAWLAGAFHEVRSSFELRPGLEVAPGGRTGAALGLRHLAGSVEMDHVLAVELPGRATIASEEAYELGGHLRLASTAALPLGHGRAAAGLGLLAVASGEVFPGAVIEDPAVRGGNRIRWELGWDTEDAWSWGLGLSGTHQRGFAGAAGHADWVAPELRFAWTDGPFALHGQLEYAVGRAREGRDLSSLGARLRLARGWGR